MLKISTVSLIMTLNEQSSFFKTIDGCPENFRGFIQKKAPLLTYVNHKLELHTEVTNIPHNIRYLKQTIIQSDLPDCTSVDKITHNISVHFPSLIMNDEFNTISLMYTIEQVAKVISQNAYITGDYSLLDTVRIILAQEINNAFAQVGSSTPIVHSGVAEPHWYKGQLLAEFEMPIVSIWKHKSTHSPSLDIMSDPVFKETIESNNSIWKEASL